MAYYVCQDIGSSKHFLFSIDDRIQFLSPKFDVLPMEYGYSQTAVSTAALAPPFGLVVPSYNIEKHQLSTQTSIFAKNILDISTHTETNTEEIYGVVQITDSKNKVVWAMLDLF